MRPCEAYDSYDTASAHDTHVRVDAVLLSLVYNNMVSLSVQAVGHDFCGNQSVVGEGIGNPFLVVRGFVPALIQSLPEVCHLLLQIDIVLRELSVGLFQTDETDCLGIPCGGFSHQRVCGSEEHASLIAVVLEQQGKTDDL